MSDEPVQQVIEDVRRTAPVPDVSQEQIIRDGKRAAARSRYDEAFHNLRRGVLRWMSSEMSEAHSAYDAELEYCEEWIVQSARDLLEAKAELGE